MCKEGLIYKVSSIRWGKESAGIVYSNVVFATDSQSKVNYLTAVMQAQNDPKYTVSWKVKTNEERFVTKFIDLTANDVITINNSVIDYVNKCFAKEYTISKSVDKAKSLADLMKIDLESGWPSREY